jgi:hypothetical protein
MENEIYESENQLGFSPEANETKSVKIFGRIMTCSNSVLEAEHPPQT